MVINNNGAIKTLSVLLRMEGGHRLQTAAEDGTNVSLPLNYKYAPTFFIVWCLLPSPPLFFELSLSPDWFIVLIMSAHVNSCFTHIIGESVRTLKEWKVPDAYKSWRHTYYLINKIRLCRLTWQICAFVKKEKKKKGLGWRRIRKWTCLLSQHSFTFIRGRCVIPRWHLSW